MLLLQGLYTREHLFPTTPNTGDVLEGKVGVCHLSSLETALVHRR